MNRSVSDDGRGLAGVKSKIKSICRQAPQMRAGVMMIKLRTRGLTTDERRHITHTHKFSLYRDLHTAALFESDADPNESYTSAAAGFDTGKSMKGAVPRAVKPVAQFNPHFRFKESRARSRAAPRRRVIGGRRAE
jgi:hypothetical protein